jgi:methionyl-tRNA synthetase
MIFKNLDGKLSAFEPSEADRVLLDAVHAACAVEFPQAFTALDLSGAIDAWMKAVFACNQYVDEQAPWALRKNDPERMRVVLMTLFSVVRSLSIAIRPVVPTSADHLLGQMGIPAQGRDYAALEGSDWLLALVNSGFTLEQPVGVFPRLELLDEEAAD